MPLRVCLVALNAYPVIDSAIPGGISGIETRSWTFARGLAQQPELEVSFVVRHGRPLRQSQYEGVQIWLMRDRLYDVRTSLALRLQRLPAFPWIRLKQPRPSDLLYLPWLALKKILSRPHNPCQPLPLLQKIPTDLFLTFGVQSNSATVIASAHAAGHPAVLFLGSDSDLDERYLTQKNFVSTYRDSAHVCCWIIGQADEILCQTEAQQVMLRRFGREAKILRNPIDLAAWDEGMKISLPHEETAGLSRYALWIGRAESVHKRPLKLIELAVKCPEIEFLMVLNRRDDAVEAEVRRTAPKNVHIIQRVSFPHMPAVMSRAAVLVNTSTLEGFPNTFLQAAATGLPVASLNVEADFLRKTRGGICTEGDLDRLANYIRDCWTESDHVFDSQAARANIQEHHDLQAQSQRLAAILNDVKAQPLKSQPVTI